LALRDVAAIKVGLVGAVVADPDDVLAFGVSFPDVVRAERAANAYLVDPADAFARPLTLRSYGYDSLRWLRFLLSVGVGFDGAVRGDYTDLRRWLIDPHNPEALARHLNDAQYVALWDELGCDRDRAMVKISVDCGARPGELVGPSAR